MKLNESEKIRMKDYLKASGHYGVTHMMVFTSTEKHNYLKIIKTPSGPTLTFKI
jgi:ribosome biogenesis protein SSF1/2